ncbi:hypothetical protein ACIOWG_18040 [Streptomyces sp. NPDC087658]|uniref:hypothetical protein n=1 Tax=Streptomyces sp. NPDC087658 TaxID=3365800 RepID=UPI0037F1183B
MPDERIRTDQAVDAQRHHEPAAFLQLVHDSVAQLGRAVLIGQFGQFGQFGDVDVLLVVRVRETRDDVDVPSAALCGPLAKAENQSCAQFGRSQSRGSVIGHQ